MPTHEEIAAMDALKEMLNKVADVKQKHARPALRSHTVKSNVWGSSGKPREVALNQG
jgi:hypothetical protein